MRVKAGIFSLTAPSEPGDDGSYLRWHLLDHMPEQYQLPGIVHALRWIADGEYPEHRLVCDGPPVGNAVHYLVGEPVRETFDDFVALGRALREKNRFPVWRPLLQISGLQLLQWHSAFVSAEVLPFRPHRGVLLIIEQPSAGRPQNWLEWLRGEHYPTLLGSPGVAGAWTFGPTNAWGPAPRGWRIDPQYITVVYLDEDPLASTDALIPIVEQRWRTAAVRPVFAGPMRTMISWEAWP